MLESGGRATFTEVTDSIFHLSNVTEQLAASLVKDLIENDPRFSFEDSHLAIRLDEIETQLLNMIDFVVVDVEAIASRSTLPESSKSALPRGARRNRR